VDDPPEESETILLPLEADAERAATIASEARAT